MIIDGNKILPVPRSKVWAAMNDVNFLQKTIPECRSILEVEDGKYKAAIAVGVGPIRANFDVAFTKEIEIPLERFTLAGQGAAGMAGSANGSVVVTLKDVDGSTSLNYTATTDVSGKFAQLGARMIDNAAKKFSEQFFANVQRALASPVQEPTANVQNPLPQVNRSVSEPTPRAPIAGYWVPLGCAVGCFVGTFCATLFR